MTRAFRKSYKTCWPLVLAMLAFGTLAVQGQTQGHTQVGGGTLTWNISIQGHGTCGVGGSGQITYYLFSGYSYFNANKVTVPLNGGLTYTQSPVKQGCPPSGQSPNPAQLSGPGNDCIMNFTATSSSTGTASIVSGCQMSQGILYPKYIVMGVTYAPPGDGPGLGPSDVQYSKTTAVGTTTTYSSSFSNDIGYGVQVSSQFNFIPAGQTNSDGSLTFTLGVQTDYTQTQDSSSSVTTSKSSSVSYTTYGYPTTYPPNGTLPPALPNDYDQIQLWINPELVFTTIPVAGNNPAAIQFNGYAYDPAGGAGVNVFPVHVGCLNGDFSSQFCQPEWTVLQRSWVQNQVSPTTGSTVSPAILPNSQDAYDILSADPLAYIPGGSPYTLLNSFPATTSDGRFTQMCWSGTTCPNPVVYEPNYSQGFTVAQMNTTQETDQTSTEIKVGVSVSKQASVNFMDIFGQKTTWTVSDTVSQKNTVLKSLTTTQTIQNAFTINGSNPPNYVSAEFVVYQDNQFGTFVFYPY